MRAWDSRRVRLRKHRSLWAIGCGLLVELETPIEIVESKADSTAEAGQT